MKREKGILPVILGADLGAYSIAASFFDAYSQKSYCLSRYKCGITENSKIIKNIFCSGYESVDSLLPELISFASENEGKSLYLIPATDSYCDFINRHSGVLSRYYKFLVPSAESINALSDKVNFYRRLEKAGIKYPSYHFLESSENFTTRLQEIEKPCVLKPSRSSEYWVNPYPGMKKVYYPRDDYEAFKIVEEMRYYGFKGKIVLQKYLEGAENYVLTVLMNKESRLDFCVFAKVALMERGATSEGNNAAILTMPMDKKLEPLIELLEKEKYVGFANFDILSFKGEYYVLELNPRQGRSSDHIRCAGINMAQRLVSVIENTPVGKADYKSVFWHYQGEKTVLSLMNQSDKERAIDLKSRGLAYSALRFKPDLQFNPKRRVYVALHRKRIDARLKKDYAEREKNTL